LFNSQEIVTYYEINFVADLATNSQQIINYFKTLEVVTVTLKKIPVT